MAGPANYRISITKSSVIKTSTILKQELRSWVGKIGVGIGLHFLRMATLYFILLDNYLSDVRLTLI